MDFKQTTTIPPANRRLQNQTGSAMVFVLAIVVLGGIVMGSLNMTSRITSKKSKHRREKVAALNIAEAGKERTLAALRDRSLNPVANQRQSVFSNVPFGSGIYSVSCSSNAGLDSIEIIAMGVYANDTVRLEVKAVIGSAANLNKWAKGAVTARTTIQTLGNIIIDGRNHDTNGVVLGTGGTFGVSAGGTVSAGGSSQIGGNFTAPQQPAISGVTVEENIDTTGYPDTPEEILGLSPGALDGYKVSKCPSTPLSGITYIDSKCTDYTGSGILICHNSSGTASLGNFHGNFKGLIIADETKHFNGTDTIIGAVVMLGKTAGGNCFGNGNTEILYSSDMLSKATSSITVGRRPATVVSWRQL